MLDDWDDFFNFLGNGKKQLFVAPMGGVYEGLPADAHRLYCPRCGGLRRMKVRACFWTGGKQQIRQDPRAAEGYWIAVKKPEAEGVDLVRFVTPSLYLLNCTDCDLEFTLVVYRGPKEERPNVAVFPSRHGGLSTPHTPESVKYFLDQAYRCRSVGAYSAALAMHRAALDHLLFEQGFEKGMAGEKVGALTKAIKDGSAPMWATNLDERFLAVIVKLGNWAIHPGKSKQEETTVAERGKADAALVSEVQTVLGYLLDLVYEAERRRESTLAKLSSPLQKPSSENSVKT